VIAPIPDSEKDQVVPTFNHHPDGADEAIVDAEGDRRRIPTSILAGTMPIYRGRPFRTVFGNLLGIYKWEGDRVPR